MGVSTNKIAEVTTLEAGLEWCVENGVHKVMIEVNILPSKEACIEKIDGFVKDVDANIVGNAIRELEEEWVSILGPFFNPECFLSDVDVSDSKDENQVVATELQTKKENFMGNAWDFFHAGVSTGEMGPF
ncbi:hypothetical protein SUGI_1077540 [Cryptomeria japonica]|nr:hypothetical protein SUGI_1077540 [Cryptomeria japonica]